MVFQRSQTANRNLVKRFMNTIRSNLEIEEGVHIEGDHIFGRKHHQRPHLVFVKFNKYPQLEQVRKFASKLKGTNIFLV